MVYSMSTKGTFISNPAWWAGTQPSHFMMTTSNPNRHSYWDPCPLSTEERKWNIYTPMSNLNAKNVHKFQYLVQRNVYVLSHIFIVHKVHHHIQGTCIIPSIHLLSKVTTGTILTAHLLACKWKDSVMAHQLIVED